MADPFRFDLPPQSHDAHELAWVCVGSARVTVGDRVWSVTETQALWLPAGTVHQVSVGRGSLALPIWFDVSGCPIRWNDPTPIRVSSELRDTLHWHRQHTFSTGVDPGAERRKASGLLTLVARDAAMSTLPPMPEQEAARRVAERLVAEPADRRTMAQWARSVHVSPRTLQRAFRVDTGLTFTAWRTEVRLRAAQRLLAEGGTVQAASRSVGFETSGGLIAAYRRTFGHTPGAHHSGQPLSA